MRDLTLKDTSCMHGSVGQWQHCSACVELISTTEETHQQHMSGIGDKLVGWPASNKAKCHNTSPELLWCCCWCVSLAYDSTTAAVLDFHVVVELHEAETEPKLHVAQ